MSRVIELRTGLTVLSLSAASLLLAGCLGGPTYGTGKSANAQLIDDLANLATITPPKRSSEVAYKPRPEIVRPPEGTPLPAPQKSLASADNPQWPESPEETRKRLREEATEQAGNGTYRSPLANGGDATSEEQRKQFQEAKRIQKGAYTGRRYLSDPPADYRIPASTAPADDLGEPEFKKERARKKAAKKSGSGGGLGRLWPF